MPTADGRSIAESIAKNILNTRFENIDKETVDNTKNRILDMLGDAIGGARIQDNAGLVKMVKEWGCRKGATILAYGVKGPVHEVAMVNCVFGRTFDRGPLTLIIDGKRTPNHTTETTVLTALALGEIKGISGKEFITATVVGDDLAARLHIASDRPQPGQVNSPGSVPPPVTRGTTDIFGAAAITARILGLDVDQTVNSFGMSVIMMGGGGTVAQGGNKPAAQVEVKPAAPPQRWQGVNDPFFKEQLARGGYEETTSVKLAQGLAAQRGIQAAQMAVAGWTGSRDPFFDKRAGYYPGIESCNHVERMTDYLGRRYYVESVFKPYPGGRPTHAPTEAAVAVATKNNINTDDIKEAVLHLSPPAAAVHYAKPYMIGEYPTMNALWSYYFAVASALVRKSSKNENFTEEFIRDPKVQDLIKKVRLDNLDQPFGVELEVKMKDGRVFTEYVREPTGEPTKPFTREGLIGKFMEQVEFSRLVDKKDAEKIVDLVDNLEDLDDVSKIVKLAVKKAS